MANKETKRLGNKGFSLVELIVVIAIMAVLVGVLAPQFIRYVEKSRQSGDVTSIQSAMSVIETGVSDGEITGNVTITIAAGGDATIAAASGASLGDSLTDSGLTTTIDLKSTGWNAMTLTYDLQNFKWSFTSGASTTKNSKKPETDMATVINSQQQSGS